jgi:hypothetical protein
MTDLELAPQLTGEAQTLTTGTEANLLQLAELRGTLTPEQTARWAEIKSAYVRTQARGGPEDDPVTLPRALGSARAGRPPIVAALGLLADRVAAVESAITDSGCVAAEAARRLSLSVRALTYRLERIHKFTGTNPADPVHRYTLQTAVIGARLLDWPAKQF